MLEFLDYTGKVFAHPVTQGFLTFVWLFFMLMCLDPNALTDEEIEELEKEKNGKV